MPGGKKFAPFIRPTKPIAFGLRCIEITISLFSSSTSSIDKSNIISLLLNKIFTPSS